MAQDRPFTTDVQAYDSNNIDVKSDCNDIMFYNDTAGRIFVNNFPIDSLGTLMISGHQNEVNKTKYKLNFAGFAGSCFVIRKVYL